jgi:hypothetical protein
VKIEEAPHQIVPLITIKSSRKADTMTPGRTANKDYCEVGESPVRIENMLVQALKGAARDLTNGIGRHEPEREDKVTAANPGVRVSGDGSWKAAPISLKAPLQIPDNDVIIKNITLFIDRVNALLDESDESTLVDKACSERSAEIEAGLLSNRQHVPERLSLEKGLLPAIRATLRKTIFQCEEFQNFQFVGLSIEKDNLLHLDVSALEEALTSSKEETLSAIKGLGSSLYERVNYFANPYSGIYADDKNILQLRASQRDEGAVLQDKQLKKEQGALAKRLDELQFLIERSTLLQNWFSEDNRLPVADNT